MERLVSPVAGHKLPRLLDKSTMEAESFAHWFSKYGFDGGAFCLQAVEAAGGGAPRGRARGGLEAREALTEAMERSVLELEMFSREAAVVVRNSRKAESRSLRGRDW